MNCPMRSLVLPKSIIEVMVVTGVSAFIAMRVVFSSTDVTSMYEELSYKP